MLYRIGDKAPRALGEHYEAPGARIIGDVHIGAGVSFWFNAVVRADNEPVIIGNYSNIQECAVLHVDPGAPLTIGQHVTIGHHAMVHGCTIGDECLIGINSVILNHAVIGRQSLIGANTLVPENMEIPERSLVVGTPAKILRGLDESEIARLRAGSEAYWEKARHFQKSLKPALPKE